jgi:hypothetical protein
MGTGRVIAALAASLFAVAATGVAAEQPVNRFAQALLAEHNRARDEVGVPRLAWSSKLAGEAQVWADRLASEGRMRHSAKDESGGAGENLWMGSAGYYSPQVMVGAFVDEKRAYRHVPFGADVSATGKWQDVGHYTQVVWRGTQEVGCAVAHNAKDDFLVCRYYPAGNWWGQVAY